MLFRTRKGRRADSPKNAREKRLAALRLALCGTVFGLLAAVRLIAETAPKPAARIALNNIGFPGYSISLLHAGASMATVHMLDNTHALFTYSLRSLVPRLPGDDANDTAREVAAVLLDVPSGKVLSRAVWHLHDHGRYLWSVGRGVFVVRIGNDLSVMAPLHGLEAGSNPLQRYALPHRPGQPILVDGSPDGKVITVELEEERPATMGDGELGHRKNKHYTLEFFRIQAAEHQGQPFEINGAGAIGSPVLLRLAMDGDGYLWAEGNQRGSWTVSFNEFGGKQQRLAPVQSSCRPRLSLLSRSQFLVEVCRGSEQAPTFAAYGFDGHENWEEPFGEALQPPTLALSPDQGRFAMSRLVASSGGPPLSGMASGDPISQEIRVYQTESGDLLLHVVCAPAVRSAENFDLSPDGRTLAVLSTDTMDLYQLPEASAKDRKDLAEVQAMTPPVGSGPVALARITRPIAAPQGVSGGDAVRAADDVPATLSSSKKAGSASEATPDSNSADPAREPGVVTGDPVAGSSRKAPTLLNPGEAAEYKGQPGSPK